MFKKLLHFIYSMTMFVGIVLSQTGVAKNDKISFLNKVVIEASSIYMSDIVDQKAFSDLSKEEQIYLKGIRLGDAPLAGEARRFTNYALSEIIRHHIKNSDLFSKYSFAIPSEVEVIRKAHFQISDAEKEIKALVQKSCAECEIQISQLRLQQTQDMNGYDWKISATENIPRGHFTLPLELIKNGKVEKRLWLQGQIKIFKSVPVLRRDLSLGMKVQSEDVEFQRREITFERNSAPHTDELYGSEIAQYMAANQVVWKKDLKRKLILQKGTPVSMVLKSEGWRIFAKGVSQDNAYVGDYVKVLTIDNKKVVTGLVTIDGTVEVR